MSVPAARERLHRNIAGLADVVQERGGDAEQRACRDPSPPPVSSDDQDHAEGYACNDCDERLDRREYVEGRGKVRPIGQKRLHVGGPGGAHRGDDADLGSDASGPPLGSAGVTRKRRVR